MNIKNTPFTRTGRIEFSVKKTEAIERLSRLIEKKSILPSFISEKTQDTIVFDALGRFRVWLKFIEVQDKTVVDYIFSIPTFYLLYSLAIILFTLFLLHSVVFIILLSLFIIFSLWFFLAISVSKMLKTWDKLMN